MTSRPTTPDAPATDPKGGERRAPPMRAPRPQSKPAWEPIPLHIPAPEPRDRAPAREEKSPRGVVIINYGDDE